MTARLDQPNPVEGLAVAIAERGRQRRATWLASQECRLRRPADR